MYIIIYIDPYMIIHSSISVYLLHPSQRGRWTRLMCRAGWRF